MAERSATPPPDEPTTPPTTATPPPKSSVRLQERRGSNLSLLLDVSSLGAEPVCSVSTPKEVWLQLLHTSSRPLTHLKLQEAAADTSALCAEYQKIPLNFVSSAELDVPGHQMKDRYKSILPNPDSRVVLRSPEEEGPERYINANYIRGHRGAPRAFIATQGPMLHTVADFWDMMWQERSSIIVMVTRLKENNEKCEPYWPQTRMKRRGRMKKEEEEEDEEEEVRGERGQFGRFFLSVTDIREEDGFTITDMELQLRSERRTVRHYWFTSWPDHHIPQCTAALLRLVEEVEAYRKSLLLPSQPITEPHHGPGPITEPHHGPGPITEPHHSPGHFTEPHHGPGPITEPHHGPGPIVVHCSAGIGRTGCFIVSSICCQQLRESAQVDILETVCQLRLDRGGMIQTTEQYQFLYSTLAQYSTQLFNQNQNQNPEDRVSVQLHNLQLNNMQN